MFAYLDQHRIILRQTAEPGGRAPNHFSTQTSAATSKPQECHRCQCEKLYPEIMSRILRVRNLCSDRGGSCSVENFSAFRRRNNAISADYARIYLKTTGEAKRLKFAGGAALGSTHIGYGMDLAAKMLRSWGTSAGKGQTPDLVLDDGTGVVNDGLAGDLIDWKEAGSRLFASVSYADTLIGLRRLVYGNLAIYMDLGAVLHFCQMHEERFHFFRDGKVEEFIECFDHFVNYVKDKHRNDHEVYGPQGTFGSPKGGFLRDGLRGVARNNLEASLSIIDHEQRHILEDLMYVVKPAITGGAIHSQLGGARGDTQFRNFMNALDSVPYKDRYGSNPDFTGIRAVLAATPLPYRIVTGISGPGSYNTIVVGKQPFMLPFMGGNFANPNVRTPWFKEVVRHFVRAENEQFSWPSSSPPYVQQYFYKDANTPAKAAEINVASPPKLRPILYAEIAAVAGRG